MVLDAHFDVLLDVLAYRKKGERKILERRHLPNLKEAGISTLICSLYICEEYLPEGALRNALDQISALKEELEESGEHFVLCRDSAEARRAAETGKIGIFLSLEGAEPLGNDILLLRTFYDLGVRLSGSLGRAGIMRETEAALTLPTPRSFRADLPNLEESLSLRLRKWGWSWMSAILTTRAFMRWRI